MLKCNFDADVNFVADMQGTQTKKLYFAGETIIVVLKRFLRGITEIDKLYYCHVKKKHVIWQKISNLKTCFCFCFYFVLFSLFDLYLSVCNVMNRYAELYLKQICNIGNQSINYRVVSTIDTNFSYMVKRYCQKQALEQ